MNKILLGSIIVAIASTAISNVSAMTGDTTSGLAEIVKMQDPYEQCVAYTKLKNITDVDCKAKIDALKKKQEQKMQAEENDRQKDIKVIATSWKKPDNTTGWDKQKPSVPPINIDALMDHYMRAIDESGVQLTAEQRIKIIEALRTQFSKVMSDNKLKESKQEAQKEIKEIHQEAKKEIKEIRTTQKSDIKNKQEAMRKFLKEKKEAMKNKIPSQTNTNQ